MSRVFRVYVLLFSLILTLLGCSKDNDTVSYKMNYGTVEQGSTVGSSGLFIRLDNGVMLRVVEQLVAIDKLETGDRLMFSYSLLGEADKEISGSTEAKPLDIRLNNFTTLLTKQLKLSTGLPEGWIEGMWRDPIKVEKMWLSGKYLNLDFSVMVNSNSKQKHDIWLIYDNQHTNETETGDRVAKLYIKHDANGDVPTEENLSKIVTARLFVSFDILSLVPEGQKSVKIEINWHEMIDGKPLGEPESKRTSAEFTPYQGNIYGVVSRR